MRSVFLLALSVTVLANLGCATASITENSPRTSGIVQRFPTDEAVATPPQPRPSPDSLPEPSSAFRATPWTTVTDGMSVKTLYVDSRDQDGVIIYKFDLTKFELAFHLMRQNGNGAKTSEEVLNSGNFELVIPASMFDHNGKSVSHLRNYDYIETPSLRAYRGLMAFNPKSESSPRVQILYRDESSTPDVLATYNSAVGMERMIFDGKRVGKWQGEYYNFITIGVDKDGNFLVFYRRPYSMVQLVVDAIVASDLNVERMLYVEGDSKGTLAVRENGNVTIKGFPGRLPNLLGVRRISEHE